MLVHEYLKIGKENAIRSKALAEICGFRSVRELQAAIEKERRAGAVILSTSQDGGGYYLPASKDEVKAFVRTLQHRAKNTMLAAESARQLLAKIGGEVI